MSLALFYFVVFVVTITFASRYDDNEEIDQIVGGVQAKRGSHQFLVWE